MWWPASNPGRPTSVTWPTVVTRRQDMTRQRAAAAAEQLAALQAAAEDMQLARDSEQVALALALAQTGSGQTVGAPQVSLPTLRT